VREAKGANVPLRRRRQYAAWGCFSRHAQRMLRAWVFSGDIARVNVTANGHDDTVALMTYILDRENNS